VSDSTVSKMPSKQFQTVVSIDVTVDRHSTLAVYHRTQSTYIAHAPGAIARAEMWGVIRMWAEPPVQDLSFGLRAVVHTGDCDELAFVPQWRG
jgi:hypothetical protein